MPTNEHEEPFDFSFETPIEVTMTAYTVDHRKQRTQRRVSFEQEDNEMGQQPKNLLRLSKRKVACDSTAVAQGGGGLSLH